MDQRNYYVHVYVHMYMYYVLCITTLQERHIQLQKALQRTVISEWHIHQRCVGNKKNRVLLSWLLACSTCGNQKHCKCGKCDMHLVLTHIKTE